MGSKQVYRLVQLIIVISTVVIAAIRISSKDFKYTNIITCISLVAAVMMLLLTTRTLIEQSRNIFWEKSRIYANSIIDVSIIVAAILSLILCFLNYFFTIPTNVIDTISILALGISLSNNLLSEWVLKIVIKQVKNKAFLHNSNEKDVAL
ncbi:hypothetical protein [Bacillus cereus]|uniref:hypothetical protein n=1 Tax=Bacillus cereus TaxID=1396 RepID=UPI003D2EADF7